MGNPISFSDADTMVGSTPPALGAHTDEILAELGFDGDQIAALHADGAI